MSRRINWWIGAHGAETDGRLDGKLNIPDANWRDGQTPALRSWSRRGRAIQSQIGAGWYPINAKYEVEALAARRNLAAARRDLPGAEAKVTAREKQLAALETKTRVLPRRVTTRFVYWALLLVSVGGEFPLLSSALQAIGEPQPSVWAMAVAVGGLLFLAAHLVGWGWSKAHLETAARRSALAQALGIAACATAFILALGLLRASYLVQVQRQLGLGLTLSEGQALWPFVSLQLLAFFAACVASRYRHDDLASPACALARDLRAAHRALRAARSELDAVRDRELIALKTIDAALCRRENEFNKKIEEADVQRFLAEALSWRYRVWNLRSRKPPLAAVFGQHPISPIESATWTSRDYSLDRLNLDHAAEASPSMPEPPAHRHRPRSRPRAVPDNDGGRT